MTFLFGIVGRNLQQPGTAWKFWQRVQSNQSKELIFKPDQSGFHWLTLGLQELIGTMHSAITWNYCLN